MKKGWIRVERRKVGEKSRLRVVIFGRPVFGYNAHELSRAKRRKDFRKIKHIHFLVDKFHIPLDRKYIRYVVSDFWRWLKRKIKGR